MRHRLLWILFLALAACDEKAKTPAEMAAENSAKEKVQQEDKRKKSEGQTFHASQLISNGDLSTAHAKQDCSALQNDLKEMSFGGNGRQPKFKAVQLTVRNGRFVDEKGTAYDPSFCKTCAP